MREEKRETIAEDCFWLAYSGVWRGYHMIAEGGGCRTIRVKVGLWWGLNRGKEKGKVRHYTTRRVLTFAVTDEIFQLDYVIRLLNRFVSLSTQGTLEDRD